MSYILHIAGWFPNSTDPQNGVFIEKHLECISGIKKQFVFCFPPQKSRCISQLPPAQVQEIHGTRFLKVCRFIFKLLLITLKNGLPRLIHLHVVNNKSKLAYLISKIFRRPLYLSEHWTGYRTGQFDELALKDKNWRLRCLNHAQKISVVSLALKEDLKPYTQTNIEVIPNRIDCLTVLSPNGASMGRIRMLTVSDLNDENKNILGILRVFLTLKPHFPQLEWHLVGDGHQKKEILQALEKSKQLNQSIYYHGRKSHEEVLKLYSQHHFLVQYSRYETFSMVPAEAILSGIPVIATRSGGPEFYLLEDGGILINSEDDKALKDAMAYMVQNHEQFELKENQKLIRSAFGYEAISCHFKSFYTKK